MKEDLKVSVVVPAYNSESYIAETLDSIFAQTSLPMEVIIVDDGSSDATADIVRKYPVKLIQQKNQGICTARNVGIRASKGNWIAFLDNDDIWFPTKLEEQLRFAETYPEVGMVVSDVAMFGSVFHASIFHDEKDAKNYKREKRSATDSILWAIPGEALYWVFVFMPSMWLVRREVLEEVGMFWDGLEGGEDGHLFYRIVARYPVGVIEQPLINYRVRWNSQSRKAVAMTTGNVRVLKDIMAHPERFPKNMAEVAKQKLPKTLAERGYAEYYAGLTRQARSSFAQSLKLAFQWQILVRWFLAWLPLPVYHTISRLFHKIFAILSNRLRP